MTEQPDAESEFLEQLGQRVRTMRALRGMSRKVLAKVSGISERYIAQLESGKGNVSIVLLRRVSAAMGAHVEDLIPTADTTPDWLVVRDLMRNATPPQIAHAKDALTGNATARRTAQFSGIALIGLRGAGKSTLGAMLAKALSAPLIELNREVARETGLPVGEVMALYGQAGYRRIERKVFERVIVENDRAIVVAGGGVVADDEAFNLLLANCYTVWLKAQPEEHMSRVLAQGDLRPMAGNVGNDEAMDDLKRILDAREASYRRADAIVDTSGETPEASFARLREAIAGEPIH